MRTEENIFIPNQKVRKILAKKLNLKFDENMQDWEYEIADSNRITEFISEYDNLNSSRKEKETLMEIILDSLNDIDRKTNNLDFEKHLSSVLYRLSKNKEIHKGTLKYWRNGNFDISNLLKI